MDTISWEGISHNYKSKNTNWFLSIFIVSITTVIVSLLFKNWFFAILIVIVTMTAMLLANRKPQKVLYSITKSGIQINDILFEWDKFKSFWIKDGSNPLLMIVTTKITNPVLYIHFPKYKETEIKNALLSKIKEVEFEEPMLDKIVDILGF